MRKFIDLLIGAIFIIYFILVNTFSSRKISFSGIFLAIGIFLITYHFLKEKIKLIEKLKAPIKFTKICITIGLVICILIEGAIIFYPKSNVEKVEYILVLGAGLSNRSQISITLKDRLDKAILNYNETGKDSYIIVSGGQGPDEDLSEAEAMKNYLSDKGIPIDKIIMENKSTSTYENFKFSKVKIEEHSNKEVRDLNIKVVTTDFHALRSNLIAKRTGYGEVNFYTSKSLWYLVPTNYVREIFALGKSFILDR